MEIKEQFDLFWALLAAQLEENRQILQEPAATRLPLRLR